MNKEQIENKVKHLLKIYNKERKKWTKPKPKDKKFMNDYEKHLFKMNNNLDYSIKWSENLKIHMQRNTSIKYNKNSIRQCLYRPFVKNYLYFNSLYIDRQLQNPKLFPNEDSQNLSLTFTCADQWNFANIVTNNLSDLHVFTPSGTINTSLYRYDSAGEKVLNITEWGLKQFRKKYGDDVRPEDIFAYCHAVLSSKKYQEKYKENLKVDYPRIPLYKDFDAYVSLGNRLIKLQTEYENVEPYKDLIIESDSSYMPSGIENPNKNKKFPIMKIDKKNGIIILDEKTVIKNIPIKVFEYKIGSRSAIEWVVEYHKPKKLNPDKELHHKTLIDNGLDFYDWKNIRSCLLDLIPRIVTVSLKTIDIFDDL